MSESMPSPWIRDYLMDVAERYGSQLYKVPASKARKRVQLTEFLTYQENSYVWAWISDKEYRMSVRISKDAIDNYKSKHNRKITDCRFFLVFIDEYRPMFSPRPVGSGVVGNTPVSHISLEIGYISSIGTGAHLFGNPRELESDEKMKTWVLGLREDGGGGNVLKPRKQQELAQKKTAPPSPLSPLPLSLYAPASQRQTKVVEDAPRHQRPQDFDRIYAKRWRRIQVEPWKLATKPATEERPDQSSHSLVEPRLDTANRHDSYNLKPSICPTPPRTPSPTSLQPQGTPTNWSPSNRGSSVVPDETSNIASGIEIQQDDEPDVLHMSPEGHVTVDTAVTDTRSLQPPTPAQRIRRSPLPHTSSLPCSFPEVQPRSPTLPSQQPPLSSPPLPSSSLPPPSSLPIPTNIRKNIQRKVPHPGLSLALPDAVKQGQVQILVPNSDTSGTGSSQSYSQSQQYQPQLLSHPPPLLSSLAMELKPADPSVPSEGNSGSLTRRAPKMSAESLPTPGNTDEQEARLQDEGERHPNIDHEDSQLSADDADVHSMLQSVTFGQSPYLAAASIIPSPAKQGADNHTSILPSQPGSMHSLFSESLEDERTASSQAHIQQNGDEIQEMASPARTPRHDSEAWKEPSFIAKHKGKGKARAVEGLDMSSVKAGKKRRRSAEPESPMPKRAKVSLSQVRRAARISHRTPHQATEAIDQIHSRNRPSTSRADTTKTATPPVTPQTKPRLANFDVDFFKVNQGKRVPIPRLDLHGIKGTLLRTGRIRTLADKVENDGSVYIHL